MSSASRHICRQLLRTANRPRPKTRCRISPKSAIQPLPARQFTTTITYRDAATLQDPTKKEVKRVNTEQAPDFEDGELQTPSEPSTVDNLDPYERAHYETLSKVEQTEYMAVQNHFKSIFESEEMGAISDGEAESIAREIERNPLNEKLRFVGDRNLVKINQGFWQEDEEDEFGQVEDDDDDVSDDMITSIAESELEVNREVREYTRIAAWQLPMLLQLVKPFENPEPAKNPLRFRYTTYMGETHPAQSKVVVDFNIDDVAEAGKLSSREKIKLIKLLGVRYNPDLNSAKMSCEKYETAVQNKRYLGDTVDSLIKEAKKTKDTFEDIPLDFRHHKPKKQLQFPMHWRITKDHPKVLLNEVKKVAQIEEGQPQKDGVEADDPIPELIMSHPAQSSVVDGRHLLAQYVASKTAQPITGRPF